MLESDPLDSYIRELYITFLKSIIRYLITVNLACTYTETCGILTMCYPFVAW